ncbi:MAG TPA: hypothetical protein VGM03_15215 [Phycisphaerae bacterium]
MREPETAVAVPSSSEAPPLRWWRRGLTVLIIATCLRVWLGPANLESIAQAQIPDAGLQRKQLLEEAQRTNQILSDILSLLQTRTLKVRVESTDKTTTTQPPR